PCVLIDLRPRGRIPPLTGHALLRKGWVTMRRASPFLLFLAALGACGEPPPPVQPPRPPPPAAEQPGDPPAPHADGRLPEGARPRKYQIALDVDPRKERFRGTETITVELAQRTFHLVLHARDVKLERVTARVTGETIPAKSAIRMAHGGHVPDEL